jgi:hypothetical protein
VSLYSFTHLGRERPFELTAEDRARRRSRLKTCGVVVSIVAGFVAITTGILRLPKEVSTAVTAVVQAQLDDRYATKAENARAVEASTSYADAIKAQILEEMKAGEQRRDQRMDRVDERLDKILMHTSFVNSVLKAEAPEPYRPLPRKP